MLAVAAFVSILVHPGANSGRKPRPLDNAPAELASMALDVDPPEATIYEDGQPVATGSFRQSIVAGRPHQFTMTAAGYADSVLPVRALAPRSADSARVRLRPLLGAARVETSPSGATIDVDGRLYGTSPVTVPSCRSHSSLLQREIIPASVVP